MSNYDNKFEEAIANCPYSTDWFKYRNNILSIIMKEFYHECTFFRVCQTKNSNEKDRILIIFFELYGILYVWNECVKNGCIESGQLDKVYQYSDIAFVMYSSIANISPFAPVAMRLLKEKKLNIVPEFKDLNR